MTLKIAGQKFGRLLAIKDVGSKDKKRLWLFKCDCGNDFTCHARNVVNGHTSSCGCLREERARASRIHDITGRRFGRLLAVKVAETGGGRVMWECQCDCGQIVNRASKNLVNGTSTSCGCRKVDAREQYVADKTLDISGKKFGILTAFELATPSKSGERRWMCKCECGGSKTVRQADLVRGVTISCGCQIGKRNGLMPQKARDYGATRNAIRRARKKQAGGTFSAAQINELYAKQQGCCAWCKMPLKKANIRRDHRQSLARGGDNTIHNIEILCHDCNSRKSDKDPIEWAQENGFLL